MWIFNWNKREIIAAVIVGMITVLALGLAAYAIPAVAAFYLAAPMLYPIITCAVGAFCALLAGCFTKCFCPTKVEENVSQSAAQVTYNDSSSSYNAGMPLGATNLDQVPDVPPPAYQVPNVPPPAYSDVLATRQQQRNNYFSYLATNGITADWTRTTRDGFTPLMQIGTDGQARDVGVIQQDPYGNITPWFNL